MEVTNTDNQTLKLKKRVEVFFKKSIKNREERGFCITRDIMSVVMDKWSLFVIYNLAYYETLRFGELKTKIRGISARMLSVTLKKLESHQIIKRKVYAQVPPKVEYDLTEYGQELADKCVGLNEWFLDKSIEGLK